MRLASGDGVLILLQQIAIGAALGFSLRIVFSAIEFAGQLMGLQMGLSFATLFDPVNGAQTQVVAQFLVLTTALILFAFNGHHLVITALVQSFQDIPIGIDLLGGRFRHAGALGRHLVCRRPAYFVAGYRGAAGDQSDHRHDVARLAATEHLRDRFSA